MANPGAAAAGALGGLGVIATTGAGAASLPALEAGAEVAAESEAGAAPNMLTFYRGDQAGQTAFQSYAAQQGGLANSESVLASGDIDQLMAQHAVDSGLPLSPFVSVTADVDTARFFAGPNGSVYQLQLPEGLALQNPYNTFESEYLVPHQIIPGQIVGTVQNPGP